MEINKNRILQSLPLKVMCPKRSRAYKSDARPHLFLNEIGVIFLFGKVVECLNMYIEEIKSA